MLAIDPNFGYVGGKKEYKACKQVSISLPSKFKKALKTIKCFLKLLELPGNFLLVIVYAKALTESQNHGNQFLNDFHLESNPCVFG